MGIFPSDPHVFRAKCSICPSRLVGCSGKNTSIFECFGPRCQLEVKICHQMLVRGLSRRIHERDNKLRVSYKKYVISVLVFHDRSICANELRKSLSF